MSDAQVVEMEKRMCAALTLVANERGRQIEKWGVQSVDPATWLAILTEEVGEVAKEIADHHVLGTDMSGYREELVQVAAVAIAAIEDWDSR